MQYIKSLIELLLIIRGMKDVNIEIRLPFAELPPNTCSKKGINAPFKAKYIKRRAITPIAVKKAYAILNIDFLIPLLNVRII